MTQQACRHTWLTPFSCNQSCSDTLKRTSPYSITHVSRSSCPVGRALGRGSPALLRRRCFRQLITKAKPAAWEGVRSDLVLSSGFMAFAYHSGFLMGIEQAGIEVAGVMGTSSGALAGSLYCAGMSPAEVGAELNRVRPIEIVRPCFRPWRGGILSLHKVVERLQLLLPATFEELDKDFAVGVVNRNGQYVVINSGPLPEAVAASIAIPFIFAAVDIPGRSGGPFQDGGMHDRVGLQGWKGLCAQQGMLKQPPTAATVHLIARSSPFSGADDTVNGSNVVLVKSPRSKAGFLSLGDFDSQIQIGRQATLSALGPARRKRLRLAGLYVTPVLVSLMRVYEPTRLASL